MGTKFFEHQNGEIAYDEAGRGPLVVCAPGLGDLRAEYRFLAPQLLQAGFRVVREPGMDWPEALVLFQSESEPEGNAWDDLAVVLGARPLQSNPTYRGK